MENSIKTDIADTEQLFRLIQSIPSPKAEPFKQWIAKVARERIDEIEDPEIGIDRLMETYLKKGKEYAILTDEITKAWSGFSVKQYKKHKTLKKRKPEGQYDQSRIGPEYACRSHHDRDKQRKNA